MRPGDSTEFPIAAQVGNFVFERAGDYAAVLQVDRTEIKRWRFRAAQVVGFPMMLPPQPSQPGSPHRDPKPEFPLRAKSAM